MKTTSLILFLFTLANILNAQTTKITYESFEEAFMKFQPVQRENVSNKTYTNACYYLKNTKDQIKNDNMSFTDADYLNVFTIYRILKEPQENIELAFKKFAESKGSCYYILNMNKDAKFSETVPELYKFYLNKCKLTEAIKTKDSGLNLEEYALNGNFNLELVKLIHKIGKDDKNIELEIQISIKILKNKNH